jgi:hypothetical protein
MFPGNVSRHEMAGRLVKYVKRAGRIGENPREMCGRERGGVAKGRLSPETRARLTIASRSSGASVRISVAATGGGGTCGTETDRPIFDSAS